MDTRVAFSGAELRVIREALGLSRSELNKLLHFPEATIYAWETGRRRMPYPAASRLLEWLNEQHPDQLVLGPSADGLSLTLLGPGNAGSDERRGRTDDLQRMARSLSLSDVEMGEALGTSAEMIALWLAGAPVPMLSSMLLDRALRGLGRLAAMFAPERLPEIIRRPAPIFEGQTALDLILRGEIERVVSSYDRLLTYSA